MARLLRRSCAHGVCGSDALRINGANALACKTLVKRLGNGSRRPNSGRADFGLPVLKDLIVDMEPFLSTTARCCPSSSTTSPPPADGRERLQSQEDRERFDDTTKCILVPPAPPPAPASGPTAATSAPLPSFRPIASSSTAAIRPVKNGLTSWGTFGVWRCRTIFNCTNRLPARN
jgi:succinate dehydrogenase / fumarate reductase, iron-sulfur subunit